MTTIDYRDTLKVVRRVTGRTQRALAIEIGVTEHTIRRWETGKSKPSPLAQEKISNFLYKIQSLEG